MVSIVDLRWMTWACLGASVLSVPLFALMRVDYYRLDVDTTPTESGANVQTISDEHAVDVDTDSDTSDQLT